MHRIQSSNRIFCIYLLVYVIVLLPDLGLNWYLLKNMFSISAINHANTLRSSRDYLSIFVDFPSKRVEQIQ